jgi:hypothetical protein
MPNIQSGMNVIGADGVRIGTVDGIVGRRIRLAKTDNDKSAQSGHTHYIDKGLVVEVDGPNVRLFENGAAYLARAAELAKSEQRSPDDR